MEIVTQSPALDQAMVDPVKWGNEQWIHEQFAWLRKNAPLKQLAPDGYTPFWNVTRYNDIKEIEGQKQLFINDPRPTLGLEVMQQMVQQMTGRKHLVRSLVQMDDPDHMKYRVLTQGWFMGSNLRKLQARVDELADRYIDRMADMGGECDFVKDVAIWYPLRVIMSIFGVPEDDEPLMLKLTQELFGSTDPDVNRSFEPAEFLNVVKDFEDYFVKLSEARRAEPKDDLATIIATAQIDGAQIPELEANGYYMIIATAGHDTTSASTAGGLLVLIENPEQMRAFRADPEGLMPTAIDEMIRWVSPVRHFMRTATADTEVGGQQIKAGESMILWYPSGNRDEAVYTDPNTFRIDRKESKQIAFGFGAHVCLGQHLARMEMHRMLGLNTSLAMKPQKKWKPPHDVALAAAHALLKELRRVPAHQAIWIETSGSLLLRKFLALALLALPNVTRAGTLYDCLYCSHLVPRRHALCQTAHKRAPPPRPSRRDARREVRVGDRGSGQDPVAALWLSRNRKCLSGWGMQIVSASDGVQYIPADPAPVPDTSTQPKSCSSPSPSPLNQPPAMQNPVRLASLAGWLSRSP